jgi:hypothetical protein
MDERQTVRPHYARSVHSQRAMSQKMAAMDLPLFDVAAA